MIGVAVGGGESRIGKPANAGSDAGDDAERNAGLDQMLAFLAAATEHERIATLEAQDPLASLGQFNQPERDITLLGRGFAATLAGIFEFRAGAHPIQDAWIDEGIIDDDVARLQRMIAQK